MLRLARFISAVLNKHKNCHEPSAGVVDNLEFKIKEEDSYNYKYKKWLRPQPHYA
jgi:hypothetical protein